MKATLDAATLRSVADWCTRIAPTHPTTPILGAVLLDASGDGLTATVTDYEQFGRADLPATVDAAEKLAVSARLLAGVAQAAPADGRVELVADGDGRLRITSKGMRAVLPLMPAEDFPAWPAHTPDPDRLRAVSGDLLARVLDAAAAVVRSAGGRESITKVRFEPLAEGLRVVATDSYRAHFTELSWSEPPAGDVPGVCYLTEAGTRATVAMAKAAERVLLGFPAGGGPNSLTVGTPGRVLHSRLADGTNYPPNLNRHAPTAGATLTADRAELLALIKRVSTLSATQGDHSRHLDATVTGDALTLTAVGDDEASLADCMDVEASDDWDADWVIRANAAFLAEAAAAIPAERVTLLVPGPAKAVLITAADIETPDYPARVVLMTVRTK